MAAKLAKWQEEAWAAFDETGEVKYTLWWLANLVGKVQLYAATVPPGSTDGEPVPVLDEASGLPPALAQAAQAEVERLSTRLGGQAEIQREFVINIDVAGECYLVGWGERLDPLGAVLMPEEWEIRSVSEVKQTEGVFTVHDGPDDREGRKIDPEQDTIIRLWQRHPRWSKLADSNLRALLTDCKVLSTLTEQLLAESHSRRNAGLLFMANDIVFSKADSTRDTGDPDEREDPFLEEMAESLTTPISDPSSAASIVPGLARVPVGPNEKVADKVHHQTFGRDTNPAVDQRIEARVQRIARGLNAPVEVVMGHQQTTFANAEQVDEDKFTDHVEPRVLLLCDSVTFAYLRPNLVDAGFTAEDANRVFVWFDPSAVIGDPDLRPLVELAWRMGLISDDTARRIWGFGDDDAPDEAELLGRMGATRGILTAELTAVLLKAGGYTFDMPSTLDPNAPVAPAPASPEVQAARLLEALRQLGAQYQPPPAPQLMPRPRSGPHHPRMPQR